MCGIAGVLRVWTADERERALRTPPSAAIPEAWLDILDESVKHRGPDGQGRFRDRTLRADGCVVDVAFVHRRLSIIDHAGGQQPMVLRIPKGQGAPGAGAESGRVVPGRLLSVEERDAYSRRVADPVAWSTDPELALGALSEFDHVAVVFNGCIYNHRELRKELEAAGHVFGTDHSDSEVLVHGWREWGDSLFRRLEGMYALILWDRRSAQLIWMRDPFGEKPLYLSQFGSVHAICSTAAGLARFGAYEWPAVLGSSTDLGSLRGWIKFGWNQTSPIGGSRLSTMAGSLGHIGETTHRHAQAWIDALQRGNRTLSTEEVDAALRRSVQDRLEADVPLGCFLSGGIDSALIAKYAREVRPDIETFTVRMNVGAYDESAAAAYTAGCLDVRHTVLDCQPDPCGDLVHLIKQIGLPFGDSSLLPTYFVSRTARRAVRAALTGDGGDDLFLGYERHRAMAWLTRLEQLPVDVLETAITISPSGGPKSRRSKMIRLLNAARYGGYKDLVAIFPPPWSIELGLESDEQALTNWHLRLQHFGMTVKGVHEGGFEEITALRFDRMFYLPDDLMRKSDTGSMAAALELRAPFLDRTVARLAMTATISSLMPRGQRKGLLRAVARKYLPAEIVDRPKMGFAIPIGEWFRSDYGGLRGMLLDHLNSVEPFGPPSLGIELNMKFVRQMLDEHLGTGPSGEVKRDHGQRLYMLLVLSIWAKWLGGLGGTVQR